MASLVTLVMLLVFLMGLGHTPSYSLSEKDAADPWERFENSTNVSQDKCGEDPWGHELNKSGASQKKYQEVAWWDDVAIN